MSEPRTEAGRALLESQAQVLEGEWGTGRPDERYRAPLRDAILAIENEAAAGYGLVERRDAEWLAAIEKVIGGNGEFHGWPSDVIRDIQALLTTDRKG